MPLHVPRRTRKSWSASLLIGLCAFVISPAAASDEDALRKQLAAERAALAAARQELARQQQSLQQQQRRLDTLETQILGSISGKGIASGSSLSQDAGTDASAPAGIEKVGQEPDKDITPPPIAVLGDQGGIITKRGRWTLEPALEYTHADRSRVLFRGIELVESVLVGVFDINETREDVLTASLGARYGITNRLEIGVRVPYVYRSDRTVLAPIAGSNNPPGSSAGTRDYPAEGDGIGDVEATLRYQLTNGRDGWPFLIANIQTIMPTGSNPFKVKRDASGAPLEAATGAGFWGVAPSVTAILLTDPAILFGSLGYTYNFGRHQQATIGTVQVDYVKPGDAVAASLGIGLSINERVALNLGYAHTWAFGTTMRTRLLQNGGPLQGQVLSAPTESKTRSLQIGRYLFGVSYRLSDKTTLNWSVEIGATDDAPNVHTVLRLPFTF